MAMAIPLGPLVGMPRPNYGITGFQGRDAKRGLGLALPQRALGQQRADSAHVLLKPSPCKQRKNMVQFLRFLSYGSTARVGDHLLKKPE